LSIKWTIVRRKPDAIMITAAAADRKEKMRIRANRLEAAAKTPNRKIAAAPIYSEPRTIERLASFFCRWELSVLISWKAEIEKVSVQTNPPIANVITVDRKFRFLIRLI